MAVWFACRGAVNAASKFADIDGVRVHYKDEGTGPVVVLLHASYMNLHAWDGLVDRLKKDHRVIRLDLLTAGLTGVDTKDRYSMERNEELLDGLLKKLDVHQYALVGTSSGGIVAFRRAAAHPEETTRLVLINSAGMPRSAGMTCSVGTLSNSVSLADWASLSMS